MHGSGSIVAERHTSPKLRKSQRRVPRLYADARVSHGTATRSERAGDAQSSPPLADNLCVARLAPPQRGPRLRVVTETYTRAGSYGRDVRGDGPRRETDAGGARPASVAIADADAVPAPVRVDGTPRTPLCA